MLLKATTQTPIGAMSPPPYCPFTIYTSMLTLRLACLRNGKFHRWES